MYVCRRSFCDVFVLWRCKKTGLYTYVRVRKKSTPSQKKKVNDNHMISICSMWYTFSFEVQMIFSCFSIFLALPIWREHLTYLSLGRNFWEKEVSKILEIFTKICEFLNLENLQMILLAISFFIFNWIFQKDKILYQEISLTLSF